MKKGYVYGMAGLVTAAVGVTTASGLFDGAESRATEQKPAPTDSAAAPEPVPLVKVATPAPAAVQVVPAAPAAKVVPVGKPAGKVVKPGKVAKPGARAAVHCPHREKHRPRPAVVRAAMVKHHSTSRVAPSVKPVVVAAQPAGDPVAVARKALDNATQAVKDAKRLVDNASAEVKHAKSEIGKLEHGKTNHHAHTKKTKRTKDRPDPVGKAKEKPSASGKAKNVSVSLDSSQVKPGQSKTATKSTSDGSAWSSVTVTRK